MWPSIQGLNNMSEDCLFMNVMAPSTGSLTKPSKGFPVMVYIHAGEFQFGSSDDLESNKPLQLPTDVVLVDFNYRIGAFGYLGGDALRGLSPSGSTGNYGMQDQRFALQWVQKNIAQFGGDPDNVMLFGESSGGTCVAWHLTSEQSKGLFHKAVLESPGLAQTHTMDESRTNFAFMLGEMANNAKLTNCNFDTGAWQEFGFNIMEEKYSHKYLHRVNVTSVQEAEELCARNASCMGFDYPTNRQPGHVFEARFSKVYSLPWSGRDSRYTTQLKGMNMAQENFPNIRKCLLTAPASVIAQFAEYVPLSDTILEDQWAPVVDGVETLLSVERSIQQQHFHTPGVPVMLGSNLDEGSTFMFDTPALATNASAAEFKKWSTEFAGDRGALIPRLYAPRTLEYPHPVINPKVKDENNYYLSAVRAAGDRSISCPTLGLAYELTQAGHPVYTYSFRITPNRSVNAAPSSMRALGAFHGAEVPFVFGDPLELVKPAEREVASTMGCYWTNFAWNSNPNDATGRASLNSQKLCARLPSWKDTTQSRSQSMVFNITNEHAHVDMEPTDRLTHLRCNFWRNVDNV